MKRKSMVALIVHALMLATLLSCNSASNDGKGQPVAEEVTLSSAQRLDNVHTELAEIKAELTKEGNYDCCVKPACDWCALNEGECACDANLQAGKKVCPGCGLGWHNGEGDVAGVKVHDVKWNIAHEHAAKKEHQH